MKLLTLSPSISAQLIVTKCGEFYGSDPFSKDRKWDTVRARMAAIWLLYTYLNMKPSHIARLFEKNHATILYNLKTLRRDCKQNTVFRSQIIELEAFIEEESTKQVCA